MSLRVALTIICALFMFCGARPLPTGGTAGVTPMCAVISGGCAEAWGVSEAVVPGYNGPLFAISNGVTNLNINQVGGGNIKADMTTWSAFCGGTNTAMTSNGVTVIVNSVCKFSGFYAEVHGSANNLIPSVFVGSGIDCSVGGPTYCACPFAYEQATGLPVLASTLAVCAYTLTGDASAVGVNVGTSAVSVLVNGVANIGMQCCGSIGMSHIYNSGDTEGSMFQIGTAFGQNPPVGAQCSTTSTYCLFVSTELSGVGADFPSFTIGAPLLMSAGYDPVADKVTGWANSTQIFSQTPVALDVGGSVHVAGGGDLSQPADTFAREWVVTNTAISSVDAANALSQTQRNYAGLITFGPL